MIARTLLRALVANACLAAGSTTYAQTMPPAADMKLAHDIYKQFIEIQSGYSTGSTTPVAEAAAARLKEAGFPDSDIFLGGASPKKFNLVASYHVTGAQKPLLLLAHTDVVEAKREDWTIDPFVLNEKDGYFAAAPATTKRRLRSGLRPYPDETRRLQTEP